MGKIECPTRSTVEKLVMAKVAVVTVPYIRSFDHLVFAQETIASLLGNTTHHSLDLIAVANSLEEPTESRAWAKKTFHVLEENDENCLARGWNKGIRRGFDRGADFCLVINLDLLFHPCYLDNLIAFAEATPDAILWSGELWTEEATLVTAPLEPATVDRPHSSAFLIDRRLFELVGAFDEQFKPAYYEDSDMWYRIKLAGQRACRSAMARFFHYENVTLQSALVHKEVLFVKQLRGAVDENARRYTEKWGGLEGDERFTVPFGSPNSTPKS